MADFYQTGVISTLHGLTAGKPERMETELKRFQRRSDVGRLVENRNDDRKRRRRCHSAASFNARDAASCGDWLSTNCCMTAHVSLAVSTPSAAFTACASAAT